MIEFFKKHKKGIFVGLGIGSFFGTIFGYRAGKTNRPIQVNMVFLQRKRERR